tara:strand:- start:107 stop:631 length:525 start_codon:yes stop_codon:yes gene_type:complete
MNKESCFLIGFISKKIGFRGKLSIKINIGKPKDYLNVDFIYIDIDNQLIPYKVESCIQKKNTFLELKLKEVINDSLASSLMKKDVFLNKNTFQHTEKNIFSYQKLTSYTVLDLKKNKIGLITDLINLKFQSLIIVQNEKKDEILIPLVEDFIEKIDEKNKILILNLPEGIINLN